MRTVAIIQARTGGTRLPGKVLEEVRGKPLLRHMIERLRRCETLDEIVVAAPMSEENGRIQGVAANAGATGLLWIGDENDVLGRVLWAAQGSNADVIVELTADCPLIDPVIVDLAVGQYLHPAEPSLGGVVDLVSTSRDSFEFPNVAYPRGMDVRVFSTALLEDLDGLTRDDPVSREHVSLYAWEHHERYQIYNIPATYGLADDIRLTVDYPEDLELVRTIFEEFLPHKPDFGLADILELLAYRPELRQINAHVEQKAIR